MTHFIGIDVSKSKLDCVLIRASHPDKELRKRVANASEGFQALIEWCFRKAECREPKQFHAFLEATGPYHESVALALFLAGLNVSVVNPARIKHYAIGIGRRAKNDKQDASTIAQYGMGNKDKDLKLWSPEPEEYQQLRALLHRLEAVEKDTRREANRREKALASEFSSAAIDSLERSLTFLREEKQRLTKQIEDLINKHPTLKEDKQLLESITGVGPSLSAWMSLLFQNGTHFDSAPEAAAYVGLIPTEHRSGDTVHLRPRLSKAGPSIYRAKLYMPTLVAIQKNPDVRAFYERLLARGKPKMAAIGAAMRKLVHICFGVIKHKKHYQPQIQLS